MKERPILFSAPMVQALLDGRKTQTRRVMKLQEHSYETDGEFGAKTGDMWLERYKAVGGEGKILRTREWLILNACPYGLIYDRLWVRENGWQRPYRTPKMMREGADTWAPYYFDADVLTEQDVADFKKWGFKRRPSIHMPRRESRINLEITGVRVERLQDISDSDAKAEGIEPFGDGWKHYFFPNEPHAAWEFATNSYASLWEKINGAGSWDKNPWVWVVEFRVVTTVTPSRSSRPL